MFESRGNAMLGFALIVIVSALMGLLALSSVGVDTFAIGSSIETATQVPFSERLAEAGSVEALVAEAPNGWVPVGTGVDYRLFQFADPNNVHVARMDRSNNNAFLESSIAHGRLNGGLEPMSSQFERYEGALNYWGEAWGQTNDVLVAINGSFYAANGVPDRGVIHSGWYAKRFTDYQNGSGFFWKLDRTAYVGQCVAHSAEAQVLTYMNTLETQKYQGINTDRGSDDIIIYTPQFDRSTKTDNAGVEIVVELNKPGLVMPLPNSVTGKVKAINDQNGDTLIPFDHIVLSATGPKRTKLLQAIQVGDEIGISSAIKHFSDEDCVTRPVPGDWSKAYAAVGGSFYFLENGTINTFTDGGANVRNPRTAIAFNDDYIFFIVVDGRDPGISVGMNMSELGAFARDSLGAAHGINQDGGGSSTMVIDGGVVNSPSDLTEVVCDAVYLPIIMKTTSQGEAVYLPSILRNSGTQSVPDSSGELPEETVKCFTHTERWVANGMMMVAATPQSSSNVFSTGQSILTPGNTNVYLGPGANFGLLGVVSDGTQGTIMDHTNSLDGIYAKGTFWWKVNFSGTKGWVAESSLIAAP